MTSVTAMIAKKKPMEAAVGEPSVVSTPAAGAAERRDCMIAPD
jgi:hypothetical protein